MGSIVHTPEGADHPPTVAARTLNAAIDAIVGRWLERVESASRRPQEPAVESSGLRPRRELGRELVRGVSDLLASGGAGDGRGSWTAAVEAHADLCRGEGLGAGDVVREHGWLREEVWRALRGPLGELSAGDVCDVGRRLDRAVDAMAAHACDSFIVGPATEPGIGGGDGPVEWQSALQAVVDSTPESIYIFFEDLDGHFTFTNRQFQQVFGVGVDRLRQMTVRDILPPEVAETFRANDREVLDSGTSMEFEEVVPLPDGPHTFIAVKFPLRDADGRVRGLGGISTDITARKRDAAERERLLAENMRQRRVLETLLAIDPSGLAVVVGPDDRVEMANPAYRALTPHPEVDPVGRTLGEVWPESEGFPGGGFLEQARAAGGELDVASFRQTYPDGSVRFFSFHVRALPWGDEPAAMVVLWETTALEQARREALHVAEESRSRAAELDATMGAIRDGLIIAGPEGEILRINEAAQRILGTGPEWAALPLEERMRRTDIRTPEGEPMQPGGFAMTRALRGEQVDGYRITMQRPDGTLRHIRGSAGPIRDGSEKVVGAVLNFTDVTRFVELQREVEHRAVETETIVGAISDGLVIYDADGRFRQLNGPGERILGITAAEWAATDPEDRAARLATEHPDGRPMSSEECPSARAMRGERLTAEHVVIRRPDTGERTHLLVSAAAARDARGEIIAVVTTFTDIGAIVRAQAEAENAQRHLRTVFEQAPVVLATLEGPAHVIRIQNAAHRRLVAGRRLAGLSMREALPELEGQGYYELLDEVYRTGEPFVGTEMPARIVMDESGEPTQRFFNFVYQPLLRATGEVGGILFVGVDVTESVEARREAEEANRAKSAFLANMSHELRTPLNAMKGYADLLDAEVFGPITEAQREALTRIGVNQDLLLRLINDVLNFAKLEAGKLEIRIESLVVEDLLRELESVIRPLAARKGLAFQVAGCDGAVRVAADPDRTRQVLLNLLSNAVKYTPAHGTVRLESEVGEDAVSLCVDDTGPGIAPEDVDRIFDPFVQVGGGPDRPSDGVGLGLAISKDLAESMGGSITVASTPGKGSRFALRLPREG